MPNELHDTQTDTIEFDTLKTEKKVKEVDMKPKTPVMILILVVAVISGIGTGYGIHQLNAKGGSLSNPEIRELQEGSPTSDVKVDEVFGSSNESTFKDSAEGIIQEGGLDGEGTHKLVRPGGVSQTVYLTSAVVDLDKFLNHKVKVWGETNTAQKAGWLMDVGRIKVLELNAEVPAESKPTATPTPKAGKKPAVEEAGD
jgi:hypothetical protein